jgi:hypothetical protein
MKSDNHFIVIILAALLLCILTPALFSCARDNLLPTPEVYIGPADKVEIVYFHRPKRCDACLFAEDRIKYVVNNHFKDQLAAGKITLDIYEVTDDSIQDIRKKFGAYGSQLFVNRIKDGIDQIRYVEEIWNWECLDDAELFDATLIRVIDTNVYGIQAATVNQQ